VLKFAFWSYLGAMPEYFNSNSSCLLPLYFETFQDHHPRRIDHDFHQTDLMNPQSPIHSGAGIQK